MKFLINQSFPKFSAALLLAIAIYFTYAPGLSGVLFYDDIDNLNHLKNVHDFHTAKEFVLLGTAGPLGRPIALASFLPHASNWPNNITDVLQLNVLIHITNAILLFWLGYLLIGLFAQLEKKYTLYSAFFAASLWAFLPLLASTNLIVIQRMTSLSALFTLLGLIVFVWGYHLQTKHPAKAIIIQMSALAIGTILAIFTKENGALTPIYALVIDSIVMRRLSHTTHYDIWRRRILQLGLIVLLIYLSPLYRDWFSVSQARGFSAWERLNSQIVILWQYLYHAFTPQSPTFFGPYHDDVSLIKNTNIIILAALAWIFSLLLSIKLLPRTPWPLFALLWFFTGHLLESTVISLELLYEHRNYLAVYGFCLALSVTAWSASGRLARIWPILLSIYITLLWAILLSITIRWGNPERALNSWVDTHPASSRAALRYAQQMFKLNNVSELNPEKNIDATRRRFTVLDRLSNICSTCTELKLQGLLYSCLYTDTKDTAERFSNVLKHAQNGKLNISVIDGLFPLRDLVVSNSCKPLSIDNLSKLLDRLIDNPRMKTSKHATRIYFVAAMIADDRHDNQTVEKQLVLAELTGANALPVLQYQVSFFLKQHRIKDALAAVERREKFVNKHNNKHITRTVLDDMRKAIRNSKKIE